MNAGNDSVSNIILQFGTAVLGVGEFIHHTEMFPEIGGTGAGMADGKVGIADDFTKLQCTFVTERDFVGV